MVNGDAIFQNDELNCIYYSIASKYVKIGFFIFFQKEFLTAVTTKTACDLSVW